MNDAKASPSVISDAPINAAIAKWTDRMVARIVHVMNEMINRSCMINYLFQCLGCLTLHQFPLADLLF